MGSPEPVLTGGSGELGYDPAAMAGGLTAIDDATSEIRNQRDSQPVVRHPVRGRHPGCHLACPVQHRVRSGPREMVGARDTDQHRVADDASQIVGH